MYCMQLVGVKSWGRLLDEAQFLRRNGKDTHIFVRHESQELTESAAVVASGPDA